MKAHGIIYKHTNKINGKCYIGQTIQLDNLERRWRREDSTHHSYKSCVAFKRALDKYGWDNFDTEVLVTAFDQDSLNSFEEYFINYYNSIAPHGYNAVMIVNGSVKFTQEIKNKISESRKKYYQNLSERKPAVNRKEHKFIDGVELKHCSDCNEYKALDRYSKNKKKWDGLGTVCKQCSRVRDLAYKATKRLSPEDFKQSYQDRQENVKKGVLEAYKKNPELRADQAKRKSKPVVAICCQTEEETHYRSALEAKSDGFCNTAVGRAIKTGQPYKGYRWYFADLWSEQEIIDRVDFLVLDCGVHPMKVELPFDTGAAIEFDSNIDENGDLIVSLDIAYYHDECMIKYKYNKDTWIRV